MSNLHWLIVCLGKSSTPKERFFSMIPGDSELLHVGQMREWSENAVKHHLKVKSASYGVASVQPNGFLPIVDKVAPVRLAPADGTRDPWLTTKPDDTTCDNLENLLPYDKFIASLGT